MATESTHQAVLEVGVAAAGHRQRAAAESVVVGPCPRQAELVVALAGGTPRAAPAEVDAAACSPRQVLVAVGEADDGPRAALVAEAAGA